jgi:hypothetical protein
MQNQTAGDPGKCVHVKAPPSPGVTLQQPIVPLHPLLQDLLGRLDQSQGTPQTSALQIDFWAFLAALQDAAHPGAPTPKELVKEATGPGQPNAPPYPPLGLVTKPNLTTAELAYYLDRAPQTLRTWACRENGPIRPKRIGGILAWPTAEAKVLTGATS